MKPSSSLLTQKRLPRQRKRQRKQSDSFACLRMTDPLDWIDDELQELSSRHLRRERRVFAGRRDVVLQYHGCELINFGSNDYLNLAGDPRLAQAVVGATAAEGWGAGASPLVTGYAG